MRSGTEDEFLKNRDIIKLHFHSLLFCTFKISYHVQNIKSNNSMIIIFTKGLWISLKGISREYWAHAKWDRIFPLMLLLHNPVLTPTSQMSAYAIHTVLLLLLGTRDCRSFPNTHMELHSFTTSLESTHWLCPNLS